VADLADMTFDAFCAWLGDELDLEHPVPTDPRLDLVDDLALDSFDLTVLGMALQDVTGTVDRDESIPATLGEAYDRYLRLAHA
jgi:acyl carrier protein